MQQDPPRPSSVINAWTGQLRGLVEHVDDDAERLAALSELETLRAEVSAAQAVLTAEYVSSQREAMARDGRAFGDRVDVNLRAVTAAVARARRISPNRAGHAISLARGLVGMPHTLDRLWDGDLNEDRAAILVREATILSSEDRAVLDHTLCADPATTGGWGDRVLRRQAVALVCELDAQAAVHRHRLALTQRRVGLRPAADGMVWLTSLLPLPDGVAIRKSLEACADQASAAGDARSRGQLMADTLTARLLDPNAVGASTGWDPTCWESPAPQQGPVRPRLPISLRLIMTDQTLLTGAGVAWLEDEPVPAETALDLLDGVPVEVKRLFTDPAGALVAMESRSRYFPDGLADLIRIRDRGTCRTPWCDAPIRHTDHMVPHAHGGPTSYANGQGLCVACNQAKHAATAQPRAAPTLAA